jgi:hypothetical protein
MMVASLSAIRSGRRNPRKIFLVLIYVKGRVHPRASSAIGTNMSMKKSSDTIGNRTGDLPVCGAVPQTLRNRVPPTQTMVFTN